MRRVATIAAILGTFVLTAFAGRELFGRPQSSRVAELNRTLLPTTPRRQLESPSLVTAKGETFAPERLRGRWSLVFFGYTACPDVCPTTLMVLSNFARRADSGVGDGRTQLLFVSIEPDGDTPARLTSYLTNFDPHIIGLTGNRDSVARFSREVGAGGAASDKQPDHSTSLFVIDPEGRLAGVLLRPSDPARIAADLDALAR